MSTHPKEIKLLKKISKLKNDLTWTNQYLDLMREVFLELDIKESCLKINMGTPIKNIIPITFCQRYVICPHYKEKKIGIILPLDFQSTLKKNYTFEMVDEYFYNNKIKDALYVKMEWNVLFKKDRLYEEWKKALEVEFNKNKFTSYYRYHNPFYYKLVMDLEYRNNLLKKIS